MSYAFSPYKIKDVEFRNRIWMSPMCQYSCDAGIVNDWHQVHLGTRAVGGVGLVMVEATAVSPEGRITPDDAGLWSEAHAQAFAPIVKFVQAQGSKIGVQIAHAGRKASTEAPWKGGSPVQDARAWQTLAPSALAFKPDWHLPKAMDKQDMNAVLKQFCYTAQLANHVGFDVLEIHMAHGYLLHEFLSPLSNLRTDEYGGLSLENRMRFPLEIAKAVRTVWPEHKPLFVRISASDWKDFGWDIEQSIIFCQALKELGIDLVDCSSGGNVHDAHIPVAPCYQVPFAEAIRKEAGIACAAVGMITQAHEAENIIKNGQADSVFLARALLREPYWVHEAAKTLGVDIRWPQQYMRGKT